MFIATKLTSKCGDTAIFVLQESSKLISRKIWVIEKSWNFHTVPLAYLQKLIWGEQWKMEDFCNTRKCTIKIIVGFVLVMLTILLQKPWGTWFIVKHSQCGNYTTLLNWGFSTPFLHSLCAVLTFSVKSNFDYTISHCGKTSNSLSLKYNSCNQLFSNLFTLAKMLLSRNFCQKLWVLIFIISTLCNL